MELYETPEFHGTEGMGLPAEEVQHALPPFPVLLRVPKITEPAEPAQNVVATESVVAKVEVVVAGDVPSPKVAERASQRKRTWFVSVCITFAWLFILAFPLWFHFLPAMMGHGKNRNRRNREEQTPVTAPQEGPQTAPTAVEPPCPAKLEPIIIPIEKGDQP